MEFEAVVFCGSGRRLDPIARPGSTKALLPVAGRPLLEHVVAWCDRALFAKVFLAVAPGAEPELAAWAAEAHAARRDAGRAPLEVVAVPGETGEALAVLAPRLGADFVVLPCDFITDIDPEALIAAHRARSERTLITGVYYRNTFETLDKKTLTPDILLTSAAPGAPGAGASGTGAPAAPGTGAPAAPEQVLLDGYARQAVRDAKRLDVRMQMLWRFSDIAARSDVLYAAIYFCRRRVLDVIADAAASHSVDVSGHSIHKVVRDFARRTWQHRGRHDEVAFQLLPGAPATFLRANNLPAYLEANRYMLAQKARQGNAGGAGTAGGAGAKAKDKAAAVIGNDAVVDPSAAVGERSSVKRSAVGAHCTIGARCRLTGCVLLDGVTLADDVVLESCIVGPGAAVGAKARLTNCQVEGGYTVVAGAEAKNEVLRGLTMEFDGAEEDDEYAGLYSSLSSDDSDEDDESEESEAEPAPAGGDDDFFDRS